MDLFDRRAGVKAPGSKPERTGAEGPEEVLEGTVDRVVFAGSDGQFTVARLTVEGQLEPVTIVGSLLGVPVGAHLRVRGRFEQNPRFGKQLRVEHYTELDPATVEGIRRYLGSGLIKGIGGELAARLVARFGVRTLEILDAQPWRIREVPGIGSKRGDAIQRAWAEQREIRRVMVFLQGYGVSPAFAVRIYKRYGQAAIQQVRENPYRLAFDVWGIGFRSADRLAVALGLAKDAPERIEAGVRHALLEAASDGHVFVPRERLAPGAAALLEVDEALVEAAIDRLGRNGEIVIESTPELETRQGVFSADLWQAERQVAAELVRLLEAEAPAVDLDVDRALAWYEKAAGLVLARQQAEALRQAFARSVLVVTGGPGVGKTTIVRGIVAVLEKKGQRVLLGAPTGRAAKRLAEATGRPATTLHRLLEWRPKDGAFGRNASNPLPADLLVIDESSMLDTRLCADLLAAVPSGCRLVLVGDVDQLPSVGPGAVLSDIIASGRVPTVRLTEIFRQAQASLIVTNAHRIHEGQLPELGAAPSAGDDTRDFFLLEEEDAGRAAAVVRDLVTTRLPRRYGLRPQDIQVLVPMHRGELGAANLNALLQEALTAGQPEVRRGQRVLRVGDRVMQIRNNHEADVWNGDIGRVLRLGDEEGSIVVAFDEREILYTSDDLDELQLAYAATVHKSQGSEYTAVVAPVHTQHFVMLQRNLLYTAVTRGKRLVVLVGSKKALGIAVRNGEVKSRASRLAARLRDGAA